MAKRKPNRKIIIVIVAAFILVFSAVITYFAGGTGQVMQSTGLTQQPDEDKMQITFIDVGQGDCTLITCGGKTVLIDVGEVGESQNVISHIKNLGIKRLDCIIGTHPHSDHIGCMAYVMRAFEVGDVIIPELTESLVPTTVCYERFINEINRKAENAFYAVVGDKYTYGDMSFQILGPVNFYDDLNNMSVVIRLTYKDTSVMLTGDACFASEADMLKNKYEFSSDLLKVGHHGSNSSSSEAWINAVNPKYGVISCGENNDYGHPHRETTDMLKKHGIEYYRTDLCGDIVFQSDGKTLTRITK